jgi:TatD DNase family protein
MSRSASSRANRRGDPPPSPEPLPAPAVDSHTHFDIAVGGEDRTPTDTEVDEAIADAVAVGVPRLVQVGVDVDSSRWSAALAARHPNVLAAVALHPNGLDRYRTGADGWAAQESSFRAHIDIAKRRGVALVIHDRDAHDEVLRVLADEGAPEQTVLHCFSGDAGFARRCIDRGYVLSFAGTLTFANAGRLREAAAMTPLDQLLVETDAPFLTPAPLRGRPNSARLVPHTVRALADVTGTPLDQLCATLTTTAERVFGSWDS